MNSERSDNLLHCNGTEQHVLCRLCGESNPRCFESSTLLPVITLSYISKNMGIKLKSDDSNLPHSLLLCTSCVQQIRTWQAFVQQCQNAQPFIKDRLTLLGVNNANDTAEQAQLQERLNPSNCDGADEARKIPESLDQEISDQVGEISRELPDVLEGSAQEKKCRFTLDYVEQKIGRKLEGKEEEEMKTLIQKGDERAIYAFLFGSGTNQCWQCQICPLVIKGTMKEVAKHYSNEHQADPLYPCQLCGKVIKSTHTFKRHRTAHLSEYKCPSCDKVFQDRSKLLSHRVAHSEDRPHVCVHCGKQYKLSSHLKTHIARAHLPDSDKLGFTCEICGKQFSAKGNLTTHVQNTHSDTRPYVCDLCGKGVKSKQALQFHLNSHNGVKQFTCSICPMSFTTRPSLRAHTRRHTGEKPYPCKQCEKSFISSSARSSHRKHVHATSRQHVCSYCSKTFKVMRDLRVHQSIHTGERPYVCDECGKAFRVAANFYAHRRTHRKTTEQGVGRIKATAATEMEGQYSEQPETIAEGVEQTEEIHTLQMAQPVMNDALSQAIREHLTQTGLGEVHLDPLQTYEVPGSTAEGPPCTSYASIHPDDGQVATPGYLKQILMGQFEDKD